MYYVFFQLLTANTLRNAFKDKHLTLEKYLAADNLPIARVEDIRSWFLSDLL
jgi:hypothetical protein